jgi:hypothetical protein
MSETTDPLAKLQAACPEWSDEYLAQQFAAGSSGFASPAAWRLVRAEAVRRGIVSETMADALKAEPSAGDRILDSAHELTNDWGRNKWFFGVAVGGAIAAAGAIAIGEHPVIGVTLIATAVGVLRGTLRERAKERD